jgi:hypothetical protein
VLGGHQEHLHGPLGLACRFEVVRERLGDRREVRFGAIFEDLRADLVPALQLAANLQLLEERVANVRMAKDHAGPAVFLVDDADEPVAFGDRERLAHGDDVEVRHRCEELRP